ncbi:bovine leukaemia virus receptor (BLVR) domain-containing protein [Apiospora arundinis]
MQRWLLQTQGKLGRAVCQTPQTPQTRRSLSTVTPAPNNIERVKVKCGLSGSIHVDLHNLAKVNSSGPLLIYLPPFWDGPSERLTQLPAFCRNYPTAVINYRWAGWHGFSPNSGTESDEDGHVLSDLNWPMPIHDVLRGYNWILDNLMSLTSSRRDVYVFGSYLGASLAASLALTETYPHKRAAVRGFAAYNGIYDWTMFLPDHPIHKVPENKSVNILEEILGQPTDPCFQEMKYQSETLFRSPDGLFDPFASPCLFFHTPGLFVPKDFHSSALTASYPSEDYGETRDDIDVLLAALMVAPEQVPRRSPLVFPPRKSVLKLPDCLLLHSKQPMPVIFPGRGNRRLTMTSPDNHFRNQAHGLARLMRRSLEKVEFKERKQWDHGFGELEERMAWRVGLRDVGFEQSPFEMPSLAQEVIGGWLESRATIHPRDIVSHLVGPEDLRGTL